MWVCSLHCPLFNVCNLFHVLADLTTTKNTKKTVNMYRKNKESNPSLGCLSRNSWNLLRSYSTDCFIR